MGPGWPFAVRSTELADGTSALGPGPGPRGAVLRGARGVGKTRLARELSGRQELRGTVARWSVGTESARSVPLGAFSPLLGPLDGHPHDVLARAAEQLLRGDEGRPHRSPLVVVDDAQLLDELSALLVHHLVVHTDAVVLVAVRDGETPPDAVAALWRDDYLPQIEVRALGEDDTTALLTSVLGGEVDPASATALWALTRGNLLFLRHLVDGEQAARRLVRERGRWRWSGEPALTPGLIELVERQMGALSAGLTEVVDLLALAEPLPVAQLVALADAASVESAEQRGLVFVDEPGAGDRAGPTAARLGHPLYGEVRRARMGRLRARRQRARIAAALAPDEVTRSDRLRRAVLLLESDDPPDPALLTDGAGTAMQLLDFPLAERLARRADATGGGVAAGLTLAFALCFLHRGPEAEVELAALTEQALEPAEALEAALSRAANLLWTVGDPEAARTVIDAAERRLGPEPGGALAAMRGTVDGAVGRSVEAVRSTDAALTVASLPPVPTLAASYGLVGALGVLGRADRIDAAAARGYAAAEDAAEVSFLRYGLAHLHLNGLALAGRVDDAEALAVTWAHRTRLMPRQARLHGDALVGQAALARGCVRTARTRLREVLRGLPEHRSNPFRYFVTLSLTPALARSGDVAGAHLLLRDLEDRPHPAFAFLAPEARLARAWVAATDGSLRRALEACHEAAALARDLGQPAHEVLALQTAVGFGDADVADRLGVLVDQVEGPRAAVAAAWARAWAVRDADALTGASLAYERCGDLTSAADAATQAATVHAEHGHTGSAAVSAARAYGLAQRCEGMVTPGVLALARPLPLTGRQTEVVALASAGLSNAAIADRLVVSVRTVEGHLYRASERLGVTSRAALAAIYSGPTPKPGGFPPELG